ncbi:MAG: response regulator transcription factor [Candidatus Berkelbacteria bacterium]|nr:response regulator transcription factor [Candidatus Berkelbacteria bacterium]
MRILIVEDDHKIANAIKRGLEQEKYAVDSVYDGHDGLAFAMTEEYDLIILDRMLPGSVDGLGICRAMRDKNNHTPIIMLTAKDKVEDRVEGLNSGADDYLIKPFAFEELLARVRALLRRPKNSIDSKLKIADLVLDTQAFQVTRKTQIINLSSKEFSLLEYLIRNPDRILTKDNIINHVWDYDADILPNTVEVYIGYLRNKIDKPFKGPDLIKTVRGFGYKISEK